MFKANKYIIISISNNSHYYYSIPITCIWFRCVNTTVTVNALAYSQNTGAVSACKSISYSLSSLNINILHTLRILSKIWVF